MSTLAAVQTRTLRCHGWMRAGKGAVEGGERTDEWSDGGVSWVFFAIGMVALIAHDTTTSRHKNRYMAG